jgi:hypothetical protein
LHREGIPASEGRLAELQVRIHRPVISRLIVIHRQCALHVRHPMRQS